MAGEKFVGMAPSNVMSVGKGENGTWVHISTPDNNLEPGPNASVWRHWDRTGQSVLLMSLEKAAGY